MKGNPFYPVIFAVGLCHLFNDTIQAIIPAMFPVLEKEMALTFTQLGLISFMLNIVSSVLQPVFLCRTTAKPHNKRAVVIAAALFALFEFKFRQCFRIVLI